MRKKKNTYIFILKKKRYFDGIYRRVLKSILLNDSPYKIPATKKKKKKTKRRRRRRRMREREGRDLRRKEESLEDQERA